MTDLEREAFEGYVQSKFPGASIAPRVNNCGITCPESYAHPKIEFAWQAWQARAQASVLPAPVPQGWKLVPVEPTQEMRLASKRYKRRIKLTTGPGFYRAMLSAAPSPPSIEGDRRDAERLDWLEDEANTLRVEESPDGEHMWFEVVSYHMAVPSERVIGSGSTPRKAIDAAMAGGNSDGEVER